MTKVQDAPPLSRYETTLAEYYESLWTNPEDSLRRARREGSWHFDYHEQGDRIATTPGHQMDAYVDQRLNLKAFPGAAILDAGCGTGTTTLYLASQHPACSFVGLTLAPTEVTIARHHQKTAQLGNARFLQGTFLHAPFPAASFHAAYALESASHAEDKQAFAREMNRILKPQGTLLILDLIPTKTIPRQTPRASILQHNAVTITRFLTLLQKEGFTIQDVDNLLKNRNVSRLQVLRFYLLFSMQQKTQATQRQSPRLHALMARGILLPRVFLQFLYTIYSRYGYYVIAAKKTS